MKSWDEIEHARQLQKQKELTKRHAKEPPERQERIVCAAIRHKQILIIGPRHFGPLMLSQMFNLGIAVDRFPWEQGFINQRGEFKTRKEALIIAEAAGQILWKHPGKEGELYSEDLY